MQTRTSAKLFGRFTPPLRPVLKSICGVRGSRACSILIVEHQLPIAELTEHYLIGHGYKVCGIARTADQAVALGLRHKPDFALIDLRLAGGGRGTEVAARLASVPNLGILYVADEMSEVDLSAIHGHACLKRPYRLADLVLALEIVNDLVAADRTSLPMPRGFRILAHAVTA
ncbi:MAG: hypothetical protein ABIP41_00025 [Croceibacterium sp.]